MHLVKWIRKNKNKLMVFVIFAAIISFIFTSYLQQLSTRRGTTEKVVAYEGEKGITNEALMLAGQELAILQKARMSDMLRSIPLPGLNVRDMHPLLLGELLFHDRKISPQVMNLIKQTVVSRRYAMSLGQIDNFYAQAIEGRPAALWLVLKNEAHRAGIRMPDEDSGKILNDVIPKMFRGASYGQFMDEMVREGISEDQILSAFSNLLAVIEYSRLACSNLPVTYAQLREQLSCDGESIDVNFVKIDAELFAEKQAEPSAEQIKEQFNKYKGFFAGEVSAENPYGFGYKLPDRIGLEYIAINFDDVKSIIKVPTDSDVEDYYQKNRQFFVVREQSDPNDPNSVKERVKSYTEVAGELSVALLQQKINSQAETIFADAKNITEAKIQESHIRDANLTSEKLRELAGDYKQAADKLSEKYKIKVYSGKTGMLAASDMRKDKYLDEMYMKGYGDYPVSLLQIAFAVKPIKSSALGPFDVPTPRLFENIGPMVNSKSKLMALVRIVDAQKAQEPNSADTSYAINSIRMDNQGGVDIEKFYSVKMEVVKDLKNLAAMDKAKAGADEFTKLASEGKWQDAIDKFNKLYPKQNEPNSVKLTNLPRLQRMSAAKKLVLSIEDQGIPDSESLINRSNKDNLFINQLYSLVPADANMLKISPVVMEFKPDMSYYVIKNIFITRIDEGQFEMTKSIATYMDEVIASQSAAIIHFDPNHIYKRTGFRWAEPEKKQEGDEASR